MGLVENNEVPIKIKAKSLEELQVYEDYFSKILDKWVDKDPENRDYEFNTNEETLQLEIISYIKELKD